jgi:metal-responsive CopG/Arc/MetJ family transcriptional regulator
MEESVVTGLSIRKELLAKIDAERGDVSRSRFMSKLMEQGLENRDKGKATMVANHEPSTAALTAASASQQSTENQDE